MITNNALNILGDSQSRSFVMNKIVNTNTSLSVTSDQYSISLCLMRLERH